MTKISERVYENLTPRQRVTAALEAMARDDEDEKRRLLKSCPKKTYSMTDAEFHEPLNAITELAITVECDMRGEALGFLASLLHKNDELAEVYLERYISIQTAWFEALDARGYDKDTVTKATTVPHVVTRRMQDAIFNFGIEPFPETMAKYREILEEHLDNHDR